jgi:hypothetical protein
VVSDVSGVPVGVTLGQEPFSRALPGVTGLVSLPVPCKLATQRGRTAVAMYLFPARPGAADIGYLKAHVLPGGLAGLLSADQTVDAVLTAFGNGPSPRRRSCRSLRGGPMGSPGSRPGG